MGLVVRRSGDPGRHPQYCQERTHRRPPQRTRWITKRQASIPQTRRQILDLRSPFPAFETFCVCERCLAKGDSGVTPNQAIHSVVLTCFFASFHPCFDHTQIFECIYSCFFAIPSFQLNAKMYCFDGGRTLVAQKALYALDPVITRQTTGTRPVLSDAPSDFHPASLHLCLPAPKFSATLCVFSRLLAISF